MKNKFNQWLTIGIVNHAIVLAVVFVSYLLAGFKFHGDDFGGLMMAYALTIFLPQIGLELVVFGMLIRGLFQTKFSDMNKVLIISFLVTFALVVMLEFVI